MRYEWTAWNTEHVARHGMTTAQVEAIFAAEDFQVVAITGIRATAFGTVNGIRYKVVFMKTEHPEPTIYPLTCHRAKRGGRRK